jgi:hypothetical protein
MSEPDAIVFRLRAPVLGPMLLREHDRTGARLANRAVPGLALFQVGFGTLIITALSLWIMGPQFVSFFRAWFASGQTPDHAFSTLFMFVVIIVLCVQSLQFLWSRFARAAALPPEKTAGPRGIYWGEQLVRASALGVGVRRERAWSAYRWAAFERLERKSDHINLRASDDLLVIIPHSAFASAAEIENFCRFAEARVGR